MKKLLFIILFLSFTIDSFSIKRGIVLLFEHDKNHNCDLSKIILGIKPQAIVSDYDDEYNESRNLLEFINKVQKNGKLKSIAILVEDVNKQINISIIEYVISFKKIDYVFNFCFDRTEIIIENEDIADITEISYRNPRIYKKDKKQMKLFEKYLQKTLSLKPKSYIILKNLDLLLLEESN